MPKKTEARRYNKLSKSEYDAVVGLYETGAATLAELSDKYLISVNTILNQARLRGVRRRGRFPAMAALSVATAATASSISALTGSGGKPCPASTMQERINETRNTIYNDAVAIQHIIRLAVAALPPPSTPAEAAATVRAAGEAVAALDRINRIRRVVLRLDKENLDADLILPELPITVMTNAEVDAMRAKQLRDDKAEGAGYDGLGRDDGCEIVQEEGVAF